MSQPLDPQQISSCYRVLMISELAQLICDFSDKSTWVNLLYLSRHTFACIAPIVWENVDLKSVFLLIPEVKFAENKVYNKPRHVKLECVFSFPEVTDLTRFKVYADFVKVAKARVPYSLRFQGEEWSAALPSPFLSNLQRLVINTYGSPNVTAFRWVFDLLTPCLRELEFRSIHLEESVGEDTRHEHSWMYQGGYLRLIDHISRECLRLETLRIFPGTLHRSNMTALDARYNGIISLKHLRTLALGVIEIDQDLFLALAQLPCLETLSLHTDSSKPRQTNSDPINIPEDAFLALRHLALYGLNEPIVQSICTVSPLFRHLVKATFISPERSLRKISDQRDFSLMIAQCLHHNSPHLLDLTVFSPGLDSCLTLYSPAMLDIFRRIPLRRLRLDRARLRSWGDIDDLDSDDSDVDEDEIGRVDIQWRDFLVTVPHLEELHLDLQVPMSRYLPVFASTLPNLRLLVLMGVLFEDGEVSVSRAATQSITIRCPFYVDTEGQNEWADAPRVAGFIHRIWPNAQFEVKKSMSWIYYDEPLDEAIEVIAKFNEAIEVLRSSN